MQCASFFHPHPVYPSLSSLPFPQNEELVAEGRHGAGGNLVRNLTKCALSQTLAFQIQVRRGGRVFFLPALVISPLTSTIPSSSPRMHMVCGNCVVTAALGLILTATTPPLRGLTKVTKLVTQNLHCVHQWVQTREPSFNQLQRGPASPTTGKGSGNPTHHMRPSQRHSNP